MPQELRQVNGRWVVTGAQQSSDLVPVARPRPAARPTPAAKPKSKPPQRPWWSKLLNDAQYELTGRPRDAGRKALRDARTTPGGLLGVIAADTVLGVGGGAPRQFALGTVGATANALRMGYSVAQKAQGRPKSDPNSGGFGSGLNRAVEAIYPLLKAKPPSQMSQDERGIDQLRSSVALNVLLAPVSPGFGVARAATALGMGVRGGAAFAFNEALSTFLDDNTGGNIVNLINSFTGANLPGEVNVGQDDMADAAVKSFLPNAATSLGVGIAAGGAVSAFTNIRRNTRAHRAVQQEARHRARQEAMGITQVDEAGGADFTPQVKQPPEPAPPPREPTFAEVNAAMEERLGMRQPAPANPAAEAEATLDRMIGTADQMKKTLDEMRPPASPSAAAPELNPSPVIENPTTENFGKAPAQPLPEGNLDEDVWGGVYDPSLPESTTISKVWEELSDTEINTVMSNPGMPVIERLNQVLEARQGLDTPPPLDAGMVMAPTDKLAADYLDSAVGKLQGREVWQLRPLFDPDTNPALWQRAQALSGVDEPGQLTKADMVETLQAQAAEGGQIPIVNRLMGAQMLPTAEITPAPQVFQYKGGVNEAGEQIGNSLSGVERWDPNAEGIIQVWRDANGEIGDPGRVYVVNGHNRLAAAQRMGIPSMRVEFLDAPTAAEARLQGAISNVSDGKGTVFDAAKLAREYGITDPAQLKALGKPGASGFWKEGIAMGRLPEDVFTAAVNEQIPLRRAVIIGESGGDEETMRSAYRYLVQQGPENVKEGTLREMLAMAQRSPAASSTDQPDILTGTEWAQNFNQGMLAKADLASAVRLMLSKEKKLFGTVGRQAGQIERVGQVDATAAKGISGEASRALALFDQLKYETGPVGDLLNEGTQRVLAGQSAADVAKGIKNRLAASIQEAMGKEVAPVTDAVQEDMFAAAGRQVDEAPPSEPIELTQAERDAGEAQILHEAIAGGEVRPYNSPLPELPEPAQVRLDELTDEPLAPGSKQAQAVADEIRLAVEHKQADAALQFEQQQALRDATDYEGLSFDEKKDMGLVEGVDEVITPEVMPRESKTPIADAFGATLRAMAESDARLFREIDELTKTTRRAIDELSGGPTRPTRPEPLQLTASADQPELLLPQDLRKASPRYGTNTVTFQSDLDRAAYVLANDAVKPSKAAGKFRQVVKEAGLNLDEVVAHGKQVKAALKQAAKGNPGQIELPAQPWAGNRRGGTQKISGRPAKGLDAEVTRLLSQFNRVEVTARMNELTDALRGVVGNDVRIRILDTYKVAKQDDAWGGGGEMVDVAGMYELWKDTIHLYRQVDNTDVPFDELLNTGFHESFHRIVRLAMPDQDMAVLNTPLARLKAKGAMLDWGSDGDKIAYDELLTEAAARVFSARAKGQDPFQAILKTASGTADETLKPSVTKSLHKAAETVLGVLNKVYDIVERTVNLFQGRGFESISSVFERAASGEMRQTIDALKVDPATLAPRSMPGLFRGAKVNFWEQYNVFGEPIVAGKGPQPGLKQGLFDSETMAPPPTKAAAQRVRQQIDAIDQSMNDIRRKAQQEGC